MIAMTSISPSHANPDAQRIAIGTWTAHGISPVSFNSPKEVEDLSPQYPSVKFITCHRNGSGLFKAPYAMVNTFIDHAKETKQDCAFIINSDVAISDPDNVLHEYVRRSEAGLVFSNRYDHNGDNQNPTRYDHGFDAFIMHRKHFDVLPQSLFAMGQTWWDYWIPYRFIRSGVPIQLIKEPIFLHHRHALQYHQKEWERMTEHFVWMEQYGRQPYQPNGRNAQRVTNEVFKLIQHHVR